MYTLEVWAAQQGRSPEEILEELIPEFFEQFDDVDDLRRFFA